MGRAAVSRPEISPDTTFVQPFHTDEVRSTLAGDTLSIRVSPHRVNKTYLICHNQAGGCTVELTTQELRDLRDELIHLIDGL